jgi:uncharacterized membrane protein
VTVLSAWTFGTDEGASHSAAILKDLVRRGRVRVADALVVRWRASARAPRVTSVAPDDEMRQPELLDLVVGVTYAVPLLQAAVGEGRIEQGSALAGIGVDETFTNKMRDRLVPGTSALLVLCDDDAVEWLRTDLDQPEHPDLVTIGLDHDLDREPDGPPGRGVLRQEKSS